MFGGDFAGRCSLRGLQKARRTRCPVLVHPLRTAAQRCARELANRPSALRAGNRAIPSAPCAWMPFAVCLMAIATFLWASGRDAFAEHARGRKESPGALAGNRLEQGAAGALGFHYSGMVYSPPADYALTKGAKKLQHLDIVIARLVGSQYYRPELVNEFLTKVPDAEIWVTENLVGNAQPGEPVLVSHFNTELTYNIINFLDHKNMPVRMTPKQRQIIKLGLATSSAWDWITKRLADEANFPKWYRHDVFETDMVQYTEKLIAFLDARTLFNDGQSTEEDLKKSLMEILTEIRIPIRALEAIRLDSALFAHPAYNLLWYRPAVSPGQGVVEDHPFSLKYGGAFLRWCHSQRHLLSAAGDYKNKEFRKDIMDRYFRYLAQVRFMDGDAQISANPRLTNRPPYSARLSVHPSLGPLFSAVHGTDYHFTMQIDKSTWDVFDHLGMKFKFKWEYSEVSTQQNGPQVAQENWHTPSWGAVIKSRYQRDFHHTYEDLRHKSFDVFTEVGPPGISLIAANGILRPIGTTLRAGFEVLTSGSDSSEVNIVFPHPGLWMVRCTATPVSEEDDEIKRAASEAYQIINVQEIEELADFQIHLALDLKTQQEALLNRLEADSQNQAAQQEAIVLRKTLQGHWGVLLEQQKAELLSYANKKNLSSTQHAQIKKQLEQTEQLIGLRTSREKDLVNSEKLVSVFISDVGENFSLNLETSITQLANDRYAAYLSDLTTAKSGARTGYGATKEGAIRDAIKQILESSVGYGRGYCVFSLQGHTHRIRIQASAGALLSEALSNLTTVLSVAAIVAAPFTEGASLALLVPLGAVGALPSIYRIADRAQMHALYFDLDTAMDVVNILAGAAGAGSAVAAGHATALKAAGHLGKLRLFKAGANTLAILGMGTNGLGILLLSASIIESLESLEGLPPGLRLARTMEILGQAMLNAGMMIGSAVVEQGIRQRMLFEQEYRISTIAGNGKYLVTHEGSITPQWLDRTITDHFSSSNPTHNSVLVRRAENRFDLHIKASQGGSETIVPVTLAVLPEAQLPLGPHGAKSGPTLSEIVRTEAGWEIKILVSEKLSRSLDIISTVGHEFDELIELIHQYPNASQKELNEQVRISVFAESPGTNPTCHDKATAKQLVKLFQRLQNLEHLDPKKQFEAAQELTQFHIHRQIEMLIDSMHLGTVDAGSELRMRTVTEAGAPPELIARIEALSRQQQLEAAAQLVAGKQESAAGRAKQERVETRVPGLYLGYQFYLPLEEYFKMSGFKFKREVQTLANGEKSLRIDVLDPRGNKGYVIRTYDPKTKTLTMREAFLRGYHEDGTQVAVDRWIKAGKPLTPRGTPLQAFLTMLCMQEFGVKSGELQFVKVAKIQNLDTIFSLAAQEKAAALQGVALRVDASVRETSSVRYNETVIIQSGHKIEAVMVDLGQRKPIGELLEAIETDGHTLKKPIQELVDAHNELLKKNGLSRNDAMFWNFDIVLKLKPLQDLPEVH